MIPATVIKPVDPVLDRHLPQPRANNVTPIRGFKEVSMSPESRWEMVRAMQEDWGLELPPRPAAHLCRL